MVGMKMTTTNLVQKAEHEIQDLVKELKEERDELRLQIHLAKAEALDEWDKTEKKWRELKKKVESATKEGKAASINIAAAAKLLVNELKEAYTRIRREL